MAIGDDRLNARDEGAGCLAMVLCMVLLAGIPAIVAYLAYLWMP